MPIRYEIDPHRKLVITTISGTLSFDESIAHHRKLAADPAFDPSFCELMDGSGVKRVALLSPAIFSLSISCPFNSAAYRAIYAGDNSTNYALARMFQALTGDKHGEIAIFKSHDEALAWLESKVPGTQRQDDI